MLKSFRRNAMWVVLVMTLQALVLSASSSSFVLAEQAPVDTTSMVPDERASQAVEVEHAVESGGAKIAVWMVSGGISPDVAVALIAALPIVELRGAIPATHHVFDMGWGAASPSRCWATCCRYLPFCCCSDRSRT
ncbi:MAG: hypothetical protein MUF54_05165 [Polyangiaceae bacterium]|nr:hypothetical protein [Polyangiaceae bacterium]